MIAVVRIILFRKGSAVFCVAVRIVIAVVRNHLIRKEFAVFCVAGFLQVNAIMFLWKGFCVAQMIIQRLRPPGRILLRPCGLEDLSFVIVIAFARFIFLHSAFVAITTVFVLHVGDGQSEHV